MTGALQVAVALAGIAGLLLLFVGLAYTIAWLPARLAVPEGVATAADFGWRRREGFMTTKG